jgi:hypothetical protein
VDTDTTRIGYLEVDDVRDAMEAHADVLFGQVPGESSAWLHETTGLGAVVSTSAEAWARGRERAEAQNAKVRQLVDADVEHDEVER